MNRYLIGITSLFFIFALKSCAPREIVKVDLKTFNDNFEEYVDKRVIITADIEAITKNPEPYFSRDIEISGFVAKGPVGFDWEFLLVNEKGVGVRCYERTYRISPWIRADEAVRKARIKNEPITVLGNYKKGFGIELDWIEYEGQIIDTDYKPYEPYYPYLW